MKTHINNMCKSAAMGLHRIGNSRHFLDRSTTERLVHAFIFSHLDCNNGLLLGDPIRGGSSFFPRGGGLTQQRHRPRAAKRRADFFFAILNPRK